MHKTLENLSKTLCYAQDLDHILKTFQNIFQNTFKNTLTPVLALSIIVAYKLSNATKLQRKEEKGNDYQKNEKGLRERGY